jgi:hypothetical protein
MAPVESPGLARRHPGRSRTRILTQDTRHSRTVGRRRCRTSGSTAAPRRDPKGTADPPAAGTAHQQQRAAGPHLAGGVARDLEARHQAFADRLTHLICSYLEQRSVMRDAGRSIGAANPSKNRFSAAASLASKAAVLRARTSSAARLSRSGSRPVSITSAPPRGRAGRFPARCPRLPPMTTTVWPSSSGSRWIEPSVAAVVMTHRMGYRGRGALTRRAAARRRCRRSRP